MAVEAKILQVMAVVAEIAPDRQMDQAAGGYWYLSEDRLSAVLHPLFCEYGVLIYPVAMEIIGERDQVVSGKTTHYVQVRATYRITDSGSQKSWIDVVAIGEGGDGREKSVSKALTSAYKSALMQTFMVTTGGGDHSNTKPDASGAQAGGKRLVCATDGCGVVLTKSQVEFSQRRYGRALCLDCQKKEKSDDEKTT
jgi:hypothetical protein